MDLFTLGSDTANTTTESLEEIRKMWQLLASSGMEGSTSTAGEAKKKVEKKADGAVWKGRERRKRGVG